MNQYRRFELQDFAVITPDDSQAIAHAAEGPALKEPTSKENAQLSDPDFVEDPALLDEQQSVLGPGMHVLNQEQLEDIINESYQQGYEEATKHWQEVLEEQQQDHEFAQILKKKLQELSNIYQQQHDQLSVIYVQLLSTLAHKLSLTLPVDFEQILTSNIFEAINRLQISQAITVRLSPSRLGYCQQLLGRSDIAPELQEKIIFLEDKSMHINDCQLEWSGSKILYNHEEITAQVLDTISSVLLNFKH